MRILNIIEEGRFGGPQARIALVARGLADLGIETIVIYPKLDSERFATCLAEQRVPAVELDLTRLSKQWNILLRYALRFLPEILTLRQTIKRLKPDIVHVNGSYQIKGAIAAKTLGVPVVWHLNDTSAPSIIRRLFFTVARITATEFIVAGERVREYYLTGTPLDNKPVIECHAPVDPVRFDPSNVTPWAGMSGKGIKILLLANVNPVKGHEHFIEMARILNTRQEGLLFYIGGGMFKSQEAYATALKEQVKALGLCNLTFLGPVTDVPGALKTSDIFVLTSIAEASPTAVWEAMIMGKPIVTTDVGSVSEYIEDGVSGFIVRPQDPEALADRVERLARDPGLRERMGRAAREIALDRLTVTAAALRHKEAYYKLTNQ